MDSVSSESYSQSYSESSEVDWSVPSESYSQSSVTPPVVTPRQTEYVAHVWESSAYCQPGPSNFVLILKCCQYITGGVSEAITEACTGYSSEVKNMVILT